MTPSERKRRRYRTSPEYRARTIQRVKEYHQRHVSDPNYRALVAIRKRISDVRESLRMRLEKVAELERDLLRMVKERDTLQARWKRGRA